MSREIIADINPYQTRVVLLEDGVPSEIYIERRGRERTVGNIYKGRVQNVLPGMQAAFVDIGLERNAFLYAGDIFIDHSDFQFDHEEHELRIEPANIRDMVKPGQEIMVQVLKEPVGTKGARITTNITLPGRTLVLMPTVSYVGVSRRIGDEPERTRLKNILEELKPDNMGMIVRTAAEGKNEEDFAADIKFLVRLWDRIQQKGKVLTAPRLIHSEEPLIFRTIRDLFTSDVSRLVINDRSFFEKAQIVASIISPTLSDRVTLYEGVPDMFDQLGLESVIDKALSRKVWLKNGAYIVIDQTEALTTIDVNTGKYVGNDNLRDTITQTNCEAAKEIAHQLRLRDISGIIIVDFIDMEELADKERVLETLREELKKDRTKSNVLGITELGLVEMTRKKVRHCIKDTLETRCPYCGGDGRVLSKETVLLKVRKKLMTCYSMESSKDYLVTVHPTVAELIEQEHTAQAPILPVEAGRHIYVEANESLHVEEFSVCALTDKRDLEKAREKGKVY